MGWRMWTENVIIIATQLPTDSATVFAYGHFVIQIKNNLDKLYLNVDGKSIVKTTENSNYEFLW